MAEMTGSSSPNFVSSRSLGSVPEEPLVDRSVSRLVSKFFWPLKTLNNMGAGVHHHLKIRYVKEPSSVDVVLKILFTNLSMLLGLSWIYSSIWKISKSFLVTGSGGIYPTPGRCCTVYSSLVCQPEFCFFALWAVLVFRLFAYSYAGVCLFEIRSVSESHMFVVWLPLLLWVRHWPN